MSGVIGFVVAMFAAVAPALAQDLSRASLADLMNIEVTSAFRKQQRVFETPAAVAIITDADIRRSGATSIPEALRLVPGVQVARINATKWAVSLRGFNGVYSNKLLVLVDGRTVYNRLWSGVTWDMQDVLLENVARIEVVRGPGGDAWGVNAVNGFINIVTKSAAETRGTLVRASGGSFDQASLAVRHGGSARGLDYNGFLQWAATGPTWLPAGPAAGDGADRMIAGGRVERTGARDSWFVQGSATRLQSTALWLRPTLPSETPADLLRDSSTMNGGMALGRWQRRTAAHGWFQLQSSVDVEHRTEPVGQYHHAASEANVEYHAPSRSRHEILAGGGVRIDHERLDGFNGVTLAPRAVREVIVNGFLQDEITAGAAAITLGARIERDPGLGYGFEPTVRLSWRLGPRQQLWGAWSRALRSPSVHERYLSLTYPPLPVQGTIPSIVTLTGNPAMGEEVVHAVEGGYRLQLRSVGLDVATFRSGYKGLRTTEQLTPFVSTASGLPVAIVPTIFGNRLGAETAGLEMQVTWQPRASWHVDSGYTFFHYTPHLDGASTDADAAFSDGQAPAHQWFARWSASLPGRLQLDASVVRVGVLRRAGVEAYARADARCELPVAPHLTVAAIGQNLFDARHLEFAGSGEQLQWTAQPRAGRVQLVWKF